jgi:hypothetical protein
MDIPVSLNGLLDAKALRLQKPAAKLVGQLSELLSQRLSEW